MFVGKYIALVSGVYLPFVYRLLDGNTAQTGCFYSEILSMRQMWEIKTEFASFKAFNSKKNDKKLRIYFMKKN